MGLLSQSWIYLRHLTVCCMRHCLPSYWLLDFLLLHESLSAAFWKNHLSLFFVDATSSSSIRYNTVSNSILKHFLICNISRCTQHCPADIPTCHLCGYTGWIAWTRGRLAPLRLICTAIRLCGLDLAFGHWHNRVGRIYHHAKGLQWGHSLWSDPRS